MKLVTDDLLAFIETTALIAAAEDYTFEAYVEACARAYCEVHSTVLVDCTIECEVREKEAAN